MKEAELVAEAQAHVDGEQVRAAGVFQPRGTQGGFLAGASAGGAAVGHGVAGLLADGVLTAAGAASGRVLSEAEDLPRWTIMAVTDTHLYAFAAHGEGMSFAVTGVFKAWRRDRITVHVAGRATTRVFVVHDEDDDKVYGFEGFRWGAMHASVVMKLFEGEAADDG